MDGVVGVWEWGIFQSVDLTDNVGSKGRGGGGGGVEQSRFQDQEPNEVLRGWKAVGREGVWWMVIKPAGARPLCYD